MVLARDDDVAIECLAHHHSRQGLALEIVADDGEVVAPYLHLAAADSVVAVGDVEEVGDGRVQVDELDGLRISLPFEGRVRVAD